MSHVCPSSIDICHVTFWWFTNNIPAKLASCWLPSPTTAGALGCQGPSTSRVCLESHGWLTLKLSRRSCFGNQVEHAEDVYIFILTPGMLKASLEHENQMRDSLRALASLVAQRNVIKFHRKACIGIFNEILCEIFKDSHQFNQHGIRRVIMWHVACGMPQLGSGGRDLYLTSNEPMDVLRCALRLSVQKHGNA